MAIGDETMIDAPVTPAPVFAYRALRAVFLGEQDTPEQTLRLPSESKGDRGPGGKIRNDDVEPAINLTPTNKRKHSALFHPSPTKSILRTPGVHTPRRALLKDINVTFKDLKKNTSPEFAQKLALSVGGSTIQNDDKENVLAKTSKAEAAPREAERKMISKQSDARSHGNMSVPTVPAQSKSISPPMQEQPVLQEPAATTATTVNFDMDAFMRTTQKEMKKLIKYGQKMRDYARRKDQENTDLRKMVDQLRDENQRLKQQLEHSIDDQPQAQASKSAINNLLPSHTSVPSKSASQAAPQLDKRIPPSHFDLLDLEDILSPRPQYKDTLTRSKRIVQKSSTSLEPSNTVNDTSIHFKPKQNSTDHPSPQKKQRLATHSFNPNIDENLSLSKECKPAQPNSATKPVKAQSLHIPVPLPLRSITTNTSSGSGSGSGKIAPDRLAAARARVRKKAEMRKASAETEGDGDGDDGIMHQGLEKGIGGSMNADRETRRNIGHDMVGSGAAWKKGQHEKASERESEKENNVAMSPSLLDWADL